MLSPFLGLCYKSSGPSSGVETRSRARVGTLALPALLLTHSHAGKFQLIKSSKPQDYLWVRIIIPLLKIGKLIVKRDVGARSHVGHKWLDENLISDLAGSKAHALSPTVHFLLDVFL